MSVHLYMQYCTCTPINYQLGDVITTLRVKDILNNINIKLILSNDKPSDCTTGI